jgi:hypothetical protein
MDDENYDKAIARIEEAWYKFLRIIYGRWH